MMAESSNTRRGRDFAIAGVCVLVGAGLGLLFGQTEAGEQARRTATRTVGGAIANTASMDLRKRVVLENPQIIQALQRGGGFGGEMSQQIALNMFSHDDVSVAEARDRVRIEELAPRSWLIRLPIVNAVLFETDAGLVLVDTGMGPAGPAILDAMRQVSDAPLHTIIYTHGHVDHAYGTWALVEAGPNGGLPEIISHDDLPKRFERYMRLRGSISRYMSQPEYQLPATPDDVVYPTRTFADRLELEIGGETFVLQHREGETDDQLYVWVPGRRVLASADYYQGFLPNAGNGKRVQRNVEEWAVALREMAALEPAVLLPAHGEAMTDASEIAAALEIHAEALQYIVDRTIEGLNSGLRKDQVVAQLEWPERYANHPLLNIQYVTPQDIAKMVIKRHTGWWDDVPSHWSPAPREHEAAEIVRLAGGIDAVVARALELTGSDVQLASHLIDWAWSAEPDDPLVQQAVIDVYLARIQDPDSNVQEILAYLDTMVGARHAQLERPLRN
jgi:glyoxylase-like metal-dependent hydrolase (beta-lactamase superfamily II)